MTTARGPISPESILLTDRVAIVTGAGQGMGRAAALAFSRLGARVAVCDRVPERVGEVAAALGPSSLGRVLDVREADAVGSFVEEVAARLGHVDILVNNAGGTFFAPLLDVSEKGEATMIAENFTQVTRFVRLVVPLMPAGGSIINLTSIEAHQAAPGFAVYAAMKAAVESLTKSLALELAPRGIRVNAVAPDAIRTEGEGSVREAMLAAGAEYDPAVVPPLGYLAGDEAGAGVLVFLAGDLSQFVTGTTVHVDGGNWAAGGWRRVTP